MIEIENYVKVRVKGPKSELKTYIKWLKQSSEYEFSEGAHKGKSSTAFLLTSKIQDNMLIPIIVCGVILLVLIIMYFVYNNRAQKKAGKNFRLKSVEL